MTDRIKRILRYHIKEKLTNEKEIGQKMDIWIIELEKKNIVIGRDWLRSIKPIIN